MKKKDGMTGWLMKCSSSCLIFMGCSLMITGFSLLLTGCTEKARKMEKKNIKVETISVGNTNLGGTKDYVGTIEEKMGSQSQQRSVARHHQPYYREGGSPGYPHHLETGRRCLQEIPAPPSVGNHLGYEMGGDRK